MRGSSYPILVTGSAATWMVARATDNIETRVEVERIFEKNVRDKGVVAERFRGEPFKVYTEGMVRSQ